MSASQVVHQCITAFERFGAQSGTFGAHDNIPVPEDCIAVDSERCVYYGIREEQGTFVDFAIANDFSPNADVECVCAALMAIGEKSVSQMTLQVSSRERESHRGMLLLEVLGQLYPDVSVDQQEELPNMLCRLIGRDDETVIATVERTLCQGTTVVTTHINIDSAVPVKTRPHMDMLVFVMSTDADVYVFEVLHVIRQLGVCVIATCPPKSPIGYCIDNDIPTCAFIGLSDEEARVVTMKRISDRHQERIPLESVESLRRFILQPPRVANKMNRKT